MIKQIVNINISLLSIHYLKIIRYERNVYDISWWRVFSLKFLHKYNNLYKYLYKEILFKSNRDRIL
jgi:hypothetical protein